MSFGFSVGDLIGAAGVTYRLIKALHGSQDAGEEYRAAIAELGSFQQALMKVSCLRSSKDVPYATSECASTIVMGCMDIIQDFLERTKRYDRRLGTLGSPGFALANGMRKMGWTLFKADDMKKLRDTLHARLSALALLLSAAHLEIQADAAEAKQYLDPPDNDTISSSETKLRESTARSSVMSPSSKVGELKPPEPLNESLTPTQIVLPAEKSPMVDSPRNTAPSRVQADEFVAREATSSLLMSTYTQEELVSIILDPSKRADCVKEISKLLKAFLLMGEPRLLPSERKHLLKLLETLCTKPTQPDMQTIPPIKFKDAVGRKFSFPWHLCKTWRGMEEFIKKAFLHVDVLGPHVFEGHYDLIGPDGEIILPQKWDEVVQPDWAITMHMWPMPEPSRPPSPASPSPPRILPVGETEDVRESIRHDPLTPPSPRVDRLEEDINTAPLSHTVVKTS